MSEESRNDVLTQAIGIVAVQLHCDHADALQAMRGVGAATDESLERIAREVIDGTVQFGA